MRRIGHPDAVGIELHVAQGMQSLQMPCWQCEIMYIHLNIYTIAGSPKTISVNSIFSQHHQITEPRNSKSYSMSVNQTPLHFLVRNSRKVCKIPYQRRMSCLRVAPLGTSSLRGDKPKSISLGPKSCLALGCCYDESFYPRCYLPGNDFKLIWDILLNVSMTCHHFVFETERISQLSLCATISLVWLVWNLLWMSYFVPSRLVNKCIGIRK